MEQKQPKPVPLYDRLPEIYLIKDQEQYQGPPDQLKHYLALVETAFAAIHKNIENLYHDLFIETCDDWVIPYIGDLLGVSHLKGDPAALRADVADTIALRRRKGTLAGIERLTYNLTRWGVHGVELRENLVWNQHLNHQRPDAGGEPPYAQGTGTPLSSLEDFSAFAGKWVWIVTDEPKYYSGRIKTLQGQDLILQLGKDELVVPFSKILRAGGFGVNMQTPVRGGTVTLRAPALLSQLGTPFDPFAHTADVKPPAFGNIRYNLPNLAIFLWRLTDYRVQASQPVFKGKPLKNGIRCVQFDIHPLAEPVQLFNTYQFDPFKDPPVVTRLDETPNPIPTARLNECSEAGNPGKYVAVDTYDPANPAVDGLELADVGLQLHLPQPEFNGETWPNPSADTWTLRGANLCAWQEGIQPPLKDREIVIDPVIGRLLLGVKKAAEATALEKNLLVTYTYGAVGPVGAHPVSRAALPLKWHDKEVKVIEVNYKNGKDELKEALDKLVDNAFKDSPVVIRINDSMTYELDIDSVNAALKKDEGGNISLLLRETLIIRAADDQRPVIKLARPLRFRPKKVKGANAAEQKLLDALISRLTVRLEGLYLTRGDKWNTTFAPPEKEPLVARAALHSLEIFNCTLDPGGYKNLKDKRTPIYVSLALEKTYGFTSAAEKKAFEEIPNIDIRRSITGPLFIDTPYLLFLTDSISDGGSGVKDPPLFAISGTGADPGKSWGPPAQIAGVTVFGRVRVEQMSGKGGIFVHTLEVLNHQTGCIKSSYFLGKNDRLPQNHGCVKGTEAVLRFVSEIFGQSAYGQLHHAADFRIRERGPGDDAMGAFGFLLEAHKWRNLSIRFREFMPVGVRPLLIPVT